MANRYATREQIKLAGQIVGVEKHAQIDGLIESASRTIDGETRRNFIPIQATRLYRWPNRMGSGYTLWLDADLLSTAPTIKTKAQDTTPTTLGSTDYFLEPKNYSPPFNRVEINLESGAAFESGDTPQRSISITGLWGYSQVTKAAGSLTSTMSAAGTTMKVSNGALIDVGHTALVGSEQVFITEKSAVALTRTLGAAMDISKATITLTISSTGSTVAPGEIIRVELEDMRVTRRDSLTLTIQRAWDGTQLSTHPSGSTIKAYRTLTVERGKNGTTAAVHSTGAITVYEPPLDIQRVCIAEALAAFMQEQSGWGRAVGTGEGARELSGRELGDLRKRVYGDYKRAREAAV